MGFFDTTFGFLFNWTLALHPTVAILFFATLGALIIILTSKLVLDQKEMKALRDHQKELQKEMKLYRNDVKKINELNKELMATSSKMFKHSFKLNIYTLIPIIILFSFLSSNFAYYPLQPNSNFNTTLTFGEDAMPSEVEIVLPEEFELISTPEENLSRSLIYEFKATAPGEYNITFKYKERTFEKDVIITLNQKYAPVTKNVVESNLKSITLSNEKMKIDLFLFKLNWIWAYILFSLIVNSVLRKLFKVY
jgi:uncharacterized membrane protein (DUF106 family)